MSSTIQDTVKQAADQFTVDPQLCIACDACCQDFPEIFFMGDDAKAHAKDDHQSDLYNARTVVDTCPTGAILFSGELPPPEDLGKLEEVPGWELEWAQWRDVEEDTRERDRRYGRDYSVSDEGDHVLIRVQFPTRVPAVKDRFRYGLPEVMPMYGHHVQQDGNVFGVYGWVKDPKLAMAAFDKAKELVDAEKDVSVVFVRDATPLLLNVKPGKLGIILDKREVSERALGEYAEVLCGRENVP